MSQHIELQSPPVFIIGGSRTGSEMLKTMLSAGPDLDFVDELFLFCPRWLHKDLATNIDQHVGSLDAADARTRLLDFLYSGQAYGWFWSVVSEQLDRTLLEKALSTAPLSLRNLLTAVMSVHAEMRGKPRCGAKFPAHYSYTPRLMEWYPDCKLIHTTREPKAVYASQSSKYISDTTPVIERAWMKMRQFVHINLQVTWTASLHRQLRDHPNYRLVRYEDVVLEPEKSVQDICRFLEIDFVPDMLLPKQYGSSFSAIGGKSGIEASSLERWRQVISPVTGVLMDGFHVRARGLLGY